MARAFFCMSCVDTLAQHWVCSHSLLADPCGASAPPAPASPLAASARRSLSTSALSSSLAPAVGRSSSDAASPTASSTASGLP